MLFKFNAARVLVPRQTLTHPSSSQTQSLARSIGLSSEQTMAMILRLYVSPFVRAFVTHSLIYHLGDKTVSLQNTSSLNRGLVH